MHVLKRSIKFEFRNTSLNHCIFESLHYCTTVLNITFSSASARNATFTYISVTEIINSDKTMFALVGRTKHQEALKKKNRYASYNYHLKV